MRVKSPRLKRHKKILELASGYRMSRHRLYKTAHEAVLHAGQYAFAGRHLRRRDLRRVWIVRIKAAVEEMGFKYSRLINAFKKSNILLDRKILSDLATRQPEVFKKVVKASGIK